MAPRLVALLLITTTITVNSSHAENRLEQTLLRSLRAKDRVEGLLPKDQKLYPPVCPLNKAVLSSTKMHNGVQLAACSKITDSKIQCNQFYGEYKGEDGNVYNRICEARTWSRIHSSSKCTRGSGNNCVVDDFVPDTPPGIDVTRGPPGIDVTRGAPPPPPQLIAQHTTPGRTDQVRLVNGGKGLTFDQLVGQKKSSLKKGSAAHESVDDLPPGISRK